MADVKDIANKIIQDSIQQISERGKSESINLDEYKDVKRERIEAIAKKVARGYDVDDKIDILSRQVAKTDSKVMLTSANLIAAKEELSAGLKAVWDTLYANGLILGGDFFSNLKKHLKIKVDGVSVDVVSILFALIVGRAYKNVVVTSRNEKPDQSDLSTYIYNDKLKTDLVADIRWQVYKATVDYEIKKDDNILMVHDGINAFYILSWTDLITVLGTLGVVVNKENSISFKPTKDVSVLKKVMGEISTTIDVYTLLEIIGTIAVMGVSKWLGFMIGLLSKDISNFITKDQRGLIGAIKRLANID